MNSDMSERTINDAMPVIPLLRKVLLYDELESTNTRAKALGRDELCNGTLIIANTQTHGRGRLGRTWISDGASSLTFSIVLKPDFPLSKAGLLSIAAGIAVADGIGELTALSPSCKWPNDVLINRKKTSGILSEIIHGDGGSYTVILGIGVNVNQTAFTEELERTATSLARETGREWRRDELLLKILEHLNRWYDLLNRGLSSELSQAWEQHSPMIGSAIAIDQHGQIIRGVAKALNQDGSLLVATDEGHISIYAGDVTILKEGA